jgi:hypothetical protein
MLPLQFRHPGLPFPTFLRPASHPQNGLKFWLVNQLVGRSVSQSVGWSRGSHLNVTLPLQFRQPGPPFLILLHPAGHPQNGLKLWSIGRSVGQSVGRSVGQSVRGKSHERHAASTVLSPGPVLPNPSTPCGPPPKRPLILVGSSVGRSQGSHMNVTLPLQFRHPGPPFPTLLRPADHP